MKPYPAWKFVLLLVVTLLGALYALPNLYGEDPAVQISTHSGEPLPAGFGDEVARALAVEALTPKLSTLEDGRWVVHFDDGTVQLKAADALKRELGRGYVVALNLAPTTPGWLRALGAKPMALGLDLRGGVHFLLEVDTDDAATKAVARYLNDLPAFLRRQDVRYASRRLDGNGVLLEFADSEKVAEAEKALAQEFQELTLAVDETNPLLLRARLSEAETKRIVDFAVKQNLTTLRNRVNQLGVAEPLVQRQGVNRIVVQLPGVQDTTRVKDLLGATATLEYRSVDQDNSAEQAAATGIVPPGDELFYTREDRRPVLLRKELIASGDQLVDATATVDVGHPRWRWRQVHAALYREKRRQADGGAVP